MSALPERCAPDLKDNEAKRMICPHGINHSAFISRGHSWCANAWVEDEAWLPINRNVESTLLSELCIHYHYWNNIALVRKNTGSWRKLFVFLILSKFSMMWTQAQQTRLMEYSKIREKLKEFISTSYLFSGDLIRGLTIGRWKELS